MRRRKPNSSSTRPARPSIWSAKTLAADTFICFPGDRAASIGAFGLPARSLGRVRFRRRPPAAVPDGQFVERGGEMPVVSNGPKPRSGIAAAAAASGGMSVSVAGRECLARKPPTRIGRGRYSCRATPSAPKPARETQARISLESVADQRLEQAQGLVVRLLGRAGALRRHVADGDGAFVPQGEAAVTGRRHAGI